MNLRNYEITVGEVLQNPKAKALLTRELPMVMRHPMLPVARAIPLKDIINNAALHPGDFLPDEKVTKESPRAAPFGIPRCVVAALFALAALRSGSRRATFCH